MKLSDGRMADKSNASDTIDTDTVRLGIVQTENLNHYVTQTVATAEESVLCLNTLCIRFYMFLLLCI